MNAFDRIRAERSGRLAEPSTDLGEPGASAFDRIRAEKNGGQLSAFDRIRAMKAPGSLLGDTAGDALSKPAADAFDNPGARNWFGHLADEAGVQKGIPSLWTPEDTDNLATYGPPAAALATGLALPAMGAVGVLATGLGLGAAARGGTAAIRGDDVSDAVLDPQSIGIDAALSGIPLAWQGAKAAGRGIRAITPDAIAQPVGSAARYVGNKAGGLASRAIDKVSDWAARRGPRYGEQLMDDSPLDIQDILNRPKIEYDEASLVSQRAEGYPASPPSTSAQNVRESLWDGSIRAMRKSDDPIERMVADKLERQNNVFKSAKNFYGQRGDDALEGFQPGRESAAVYDELTGQNLTHRAGAPSQGELAAQFSARLKNPSAAAVQSRPLRDLFNEVDEGRRSAGVYDDLGYGQDARERAFELGDRGVKYQFLGGEDTGGPYYAEAQRASNYAPRRAVTDPKLEGLSGIERMLAKDPKLTVGQAERRLGGLAESSAVGHARTGNDMDPVNKALHETVPGYLHQEAKRIGSAAAFSGAPVKITMPVSRGGARDFVVPGEARTLYEHMRNTGNNAGANRFLTALADYHVPQTEVGGDFARTLARKTSDVALSKAWMTQGGQAATGMVMAGGPKMALRGNAMVKRNPVLKELFAAGPQNADLTEYTTLGRMGAGDSTVGGWVTPLGMMKKAENFLRGPASYAAVPAIDDVAHEALQVTQAGGTFSGALTKRAAEMGTTPQALADELAQGQLSKGTWLNSIQTLANRWQHVAGAGELPALAKHPLGALALQYKTFGIKQTQLMMDDVIRPLLDGYKAQDQSLIDLGWQRMRGMALYGGAANAATSVAKSATTGRLPAWQTVARSSLTGTTGTAGDAAYLAATPVLGQKYGDDPAEQFKEIPALGVIMDAGVDALGTMHDPARGIQGAVRLGGLYDSRIPMYGAPVASWMTELLSSDEE